MIPNTQRQWLINERPFGRHLEDNDFKAAEGPVRAPEPGEVLLRTLYLGFDPALKGWMENVASYVDPTNIGDVMRGSGVAQVVRSNDPKFQEGDIVSGQIGWQEFPTVAAAGLSRTPNGVSPTAALGVLGTTGMTAYFGLLDVGKPIAGDTLVVSGAAGATGSVAGQIGKIAGCRVIGVAGGAAKCAWLVDELGFDAAIDYKTENIRERLKQLAPGGVNVFYDNVGGPVLNEVLACLAMRARVVICGGISRHSTGGKTLGPENYFNIVFMRARMEGFILFDYAARYPEAQSRLAAWIREGRLQYKEDIQIGFENAPRALMRLFQGENFGKQLLKVADPA